MDESILDYIKTVIGPIIGDDFDSQIKGFIDMALLPLEQVGAISSSVYSIDESTTWEEILISPPLVDSQTVMTVLPAIKQYIYIQVKIFFDPPVSGSMQIYNDRASELLWRIREAYDNNE